MNILYEIIRDSITIASMCKKSKNLLAAIEVLTEMLENYNLNLVGSPLLPEYRGLVGLRFFEKTDFYGRKFDFDYMPELYNNTRNFIKREYPHANLTPDSDCLIDDGLIGITKDDIRTNSIRMDYVVIINLDSNTASFSGFFDEISFDEYVFMDLYRISNLETCEYNFSNVHFNELEDLSEFLIDNTYGWLSGKVPNKVIMMRER